MTTLKIKEAKKDNNVKMGARISRCCSSNSGGERRGAEGGGKRRRKLINEAISTAQSAKPPQLSRCCVFPIAHRATEV